MASSNYVDFVHSAKVAITPRPATLTSGDGSWTHDGADVLRKEFSDGLDVDTRHVRGTVDAEGWSLRVYVGYEF